MIKLGYVLGVFLMGLEPSAHAGEVFALCRSYNPTGDSSALYLSECFSRVGLLGEEEITAQEFCEETWLDAVKKLEPQFVRYDELAEAKMWVGPEQRDIQSESECRESFLESYRAAREVFGRDAELVVVRYGFMGLRRLRTWRFGRG